MSEENISDGAELYDTGAPEQRDWFERQWAAWPVRVDESCTTNISFHYGGVIAYREEYGHDPNLSKDFGSHVAWLDKNNTKETNNA